MDGTSNQRIRDNPQSQMEGHPITNGLTKIHRRSWLRTAVGGSIGLALDGLLDLPTVRAATQKLKLANVSEFTTSCNFCSCGCGMVAAVREGVDCDGRRLRPNRGSLCVKGISLFATHASPNRLKTPATERRVATTGRTSPGTTQSHGWRRRFEKRATQPGSPPRRSATKTFRSIGRMRSASWAVRRTRTRSPGSILYALGMTQHTTGVQGIRSFTILQLLLGNIGKPGGCTNCDTSPSLVVGTRGGPELATLILNRGVQPCATRSGRVR